MKIAGVSLTFNDGYKLKEWYDHYLVYKDQLDVFIIVDNNSDDEYKVKLKRTFNDGTIVIERSTNGGCTGAYNDGIKYALENTDVDAIAIIGNDIRLTKNCLPELYNFLYEDSSMGMVSAALLNKDSDIVETYGFNVKNMAATTCDEGKSINDVFPKKKYVDLLPGGFTLAKREFYEKAGLQDNNLFMYCDELDTMYKARNCGYKLGVIANEYAWHQHIDLPVLGKRSSASRYLICRNRIYLAKKFETASIVAYQIYRGIIMVPLIFVYRFFKFKKKAELKDAWYSFVGGIHGTLGYMKQNKYMVFK